MKILIEQEMALHQPKVRENLDEVKRLLHPDFVEVGKTGLTYSFVDMTEVKVEMDSELGLHSQDFFCVKLKSSVQLLMYKTAAQDKKGGYLDYAKRSSIWTCSDEGWQLIYHQGTLCPEFEIKTAS